MAHAFHPPMFISSRLMAAVAVDDGGTIHIEPHCRDSEGRIVWRYVIEDAHRSVLEDGQDLRSGSGADIDYRKTMVTLLHFLSAAAEAHRYTLNGQTDENSDLFNLQVTEWAFEYDDELACVAFELEESNPEEMDSGHTAQAERDARWNEVWSLTGCADCAGAASSGRPWGRDHCWAEHRPHVPVGERILTEARRSQGFVSQQHLDAFYAHHDHVARCDECGRPGPAFPLDDGLQPTVTECPIGRNLFRRSFRENLPSP